MSAFFAGFVVLGLFLGIAYAFSRQKTADAARLVRILLGLGALLAGAVMMLRGGAILGGPLSIFGLGLLARAFGFAGLGRRPDGTGPRQRHQAPPPRRNMGEAEAREVLGVGPKASEAEIRAAHRSLMKKLHPDTGEGSAALARQVQEARDLLLELLNGR
ncbi:MAG: DnaJ domain-containing protein [Alphaproteobacteria bacterium]|nr:DnaJ domain-containing protein [Alphaproteobacteria bacterium]